MNWIHALLKKSGYTLYKTPFLPHGVDWIWDIKRTLPNENFMQCAVDVGANVGNVSIDLARNFPQSKIFAFEPSPETYKTLVQRTAPYTRIHCEPLAVADHTGEAWFEHAEAHPCNSHLSKVETGNAFKVQVVTLENYFKGQGDTPALIKTDTEGWDYNVLAGCGSLLPKIKWIISEVEFNRTEGRPHTNFGQVNAYLEKQDFTLYALYDYWHRADHSIQYCNAMWVNLNWQL